MNTIFVQIASYRDPQLVPTLKDLIDKAEFPKNLHVVVCWQHGSEESTESLVDAGFDIEGFTDGLYDFNVIMTNYNTARVDFIEVPHNKSQGACWARNFIQQLYTDEKYTLQLDSHHRFVEKWDSVTIEMLESLRAQSKKPLLTAYIPSFDPENDPAGRVNTPWKMDFDRFIPEGAVFFLPSTIDNWNKVRSPLPARFYSAHFAFADGAFATEVQHDPDYFFHGEEISIAVRAFTHGYDLYHPHKVIAWHEYTRKGRTKIWDDHTTPEKVKGNIELDWVERNNLCHKRNRILFGMDGEDQNQIDFGKYGFGTERTVRQYEEYAGVSFKYRAVQQVTMDRRPPVWPSTRTYANEIEWRESMTTSHDIKVCFHTNMVRQKEGKLVEMPQDFDFWYLAAHDDNQDDDKSVIFRKDVSETECHNHAKQEWVDFRLIFLSDRTPTKYVVWPHSKSLGWMDKFELPIAN